MINLTDTSGKTVIGEIKNTTINISSISFKDQADGLTNTGLLFTFCS